MTIMFKESFYNTYSMTLFVLISCSGNDVVHQTIKICIYFIDNNFRVTYGFVGNPGFVGKSVFHNSTSRLKSW